MALVIIGGIVVGAVILFGVASGINHYVEISSDAKKYRLLKKGNDE
jgi:hypothetical protein